MKLSIIVPVYNEEKTIKKVLEKLANLDAGVGKEIIVIDDGSTDGTCEILRKFQIPNSKFQIIFQEKNQGKGAAVRRGFQEADGDILIIQDADLEYNPEEYEKLIKPIIAGETKVVCGSRFLQENPNLYRRYLWGNKFLSFLISFLYRVKITDAYTGYKVMSKEIYKNLNLKSNGFEFEAEITCEFLKKGYKILEIPISYNPRSIKEGKKINYKDAIYGIWTIIKLQCKV
ncbi:MAG TPA: glycosyl transferase [Elusimicrobia bacterium]|jgi:glycosyltransferase involved in cell wall biosynthesis|nr:glycosyl transferase [Elusimicrobiota bacterium]